MPAATRIVAAAVALLLLSSCTRTILVRAVFDDGRLAFAIDREAPIEPPGCLTRLAVFDDSGTPVWHFEVPHDYDRRRNACITSFPITYGETLADAHLGIPPRRLVPGRLYVITGNMGDPLLGAFRLLREGPRLRLDNVDPHAPEIRQAEERHREWQRAHQPVRNGDGPPEVQDFNIREPQPFAIPENPAAGAAGTDRYSWFLNVTNRSNFPSLSYASLDGRDVRFDLWCRWRGAVITIRLPDSVPRGSRLELSSGGSRHTVDIHSGSSELDLPFRTSGIISENEQVLRQFGLTGRLTMRRDGTAVALDAVDRRELRTVRHFFELCSSHDPAMPQEPDLPWREQSR